MADPRPRQAAQVRDMLARLRTMRDGCEFGELRSAFNDAADRLAVLESKLTHGADAVGAPVFVTNPAEGPT
ncbi:hypothetical protein [Pseudacidovorax intermedius]|uniref:Uncharacterized protein n=1 Tax=Pseudacidovorax intermedius TaxID=433924 RepID=A0A147GP21_9BURK|nr:hypothetical protein [Pseudacidovorax intermedius]KTT15860.1 hypothetical protein NS331_19580 [Pseudacidovorax intermedius]